MTSLRHLVFLMAGLPIVLGTLAAAQRSVTPDDPVATRSAMQRALAEADEAERRSLKLEGAARGATEALEKTARLGAALAARIQQAEAGIAAAEARIELINAQRDKLNRSLAARREPLVRLTGALQNMARRPLALSALKPGSLRETVYLRAMLESTIPQIRDNTAGLRFEIRQGRALEQEAAQALTALQQNEQQLDDRRRRLAALETRQRLESRQASGAAARENERAIALAEEASDLNDLLGELGKVGSLRNELAALPGPVMRPASPSSGVTTTTTFAQSLQTPNSQPIFQLPVSGRTITGFGDTSPAGLRSTGITLSPRSSAQVIAPADGRVAFSGPYRGYDRIVIIEHGGGWTSLVTGLGRTDVEVGDELVAGSPLGVVGAEAPIVTLELRRNGTPVNPLEFLR